LLIAPVDTDCVLCILLWKPSCCKNGVLPGFWPGYHWDENPKFHWKYYWHSPLDCNARFVNRILQLLQLLKLVEKKISSSITNNVSVISN